ncbi:GNAT family N-acetyltransferase [Chitinophaga vietnamensis]|uniref:GNAT family N-acetyltransferase n=1 Tax=Chitinophaga vietnamensis TaxID=2593957 RepID=UPI00117821DF|nr:GNAT family N-acetyltransferase [Chitinophaga vietnamensis]
MEDVTLLLQQRPLSAAEMQLLLTADPSETQILGYLPQSIVFRLCKQNDTIGILVMGQQPDQAEIFNIAVDGRLQRRGYGRQLLAAAIEWGREHHLDQITIGTGNSSIGQLALYQQCGFDIYDIIYHYFSDHYPEPIIENNIPCKHMIRLRYLINNL